MSSTPNTVAAATASSPPAQTTQTQAQVIPLPLPTTVPAPVTAGALVGALLLVGVMAFALRMLWRLPQLLWSRGVALNWINRLGGAYALQNHVLRGAAYFGVIYALMQSNFVGALMIGLLGVIAVNVRFTGESGEYDDGTR